MPVQYWSQLLNAGAPWQTTQGTAISTAGTWTASPQTAGNNDFTLPANYFYPGQVLEIDAQGDISTTATSTTWTMLLAANQSGTYTTLASTAGIATGTGSLVGLQWNITAWAICTAEGSSGSTMLTQGNMNMPLAGTAPTIGGPANCYLFPMPSVSGGSAVAINTTQAQGIALRTILAAADGTVTCTQFLIKALD